MKTENSIFWCISAESQAALMQFQWDLYGNRIELPPKPDGGYIDIELESSEELAKLMQRRPHPGD